MASSRKPRSADRGAGAALDKALASLDLRRKRVALGLSGGVDSVVLLHLLAARAAQHGFSLRAVHVHHGLSPNAGAWARHCRRVCRSLGVPLTLRRVRLAKRSEALAREARYAVFRKFPCDVLMLAHQLDDQAETVLFNLLRGAGVRGASGMSKNIFLGKNKILLRPLLEVPREAIVSCAREQGLEWIEDESNLDETLTRNFIRRRIGPLLASRFPRWRESLARASRHFSESELSANRLLREFLAAQGLRSPSEAKLVEMLKQLTGGGTRTEIAHDGARLRTYRGKVFILPSEALKPFSPVTWSGEARVPLAALGGELRFRRAEGEGLQLSPDKSLQIRLRGGGERLQPDARRPRRTLKNLFQEAGVPPWERDRLPLIYCGKELVWAPGLGVDVRHQVPPSASGWVPQWVQIAA